MGRRLNAVFGAVCVLSLAVASASQVTFTARELVQRRILSDLKQAQESAGIFVDDSDLFLNPQANHGRRMLQASEMTGLLSNPTILTTLLGLFGQENRTVGGFPGIALNLPGGSPYGYAPSDDSYCLFSTTNQTQPVATVASPPGQPLPNDFTCVEGTTPPPGAGSFIVQYDGTTYACAGATTPGRKLQQTQATPALAALLSPAAISNTMENLLNAVGLPIWNCVTATTPAGNTTIGETTMAVLNDLGVVAEHFLTYLNSQGTLTYAENVQNNFVSLTNPLYPTGPRLNFSIDFQSVASDQALFEEIFGFTPQSPPPPAPTAVPTVLAALSNPATTSTGGNVPVGSTPQTNTGNFVASEGPSGTTPGNPSPTTVASAAQASGTNAPATPGQTASLMVYDGYLSNCQLVLGSMPGADGNFQQVPNFQAVITNGVSSLSLNATTQYNGSVSYIIPASKSVAYPTLTAATASSAQFCYDIATLLPVYNPFATVIVADVNSLSANAITTLAIFGEALGATAEDVIDSLGIQLPAGEALWTYNAIADAQNGSTNGLAFMQTNSAVQNLVTAGANLLTNDSSLYASYAIIMNQAIAQKILYSPAQPVAVTGRKLMQQASGPPAVDMTNATTVASILGIALEMAQSNSDSSTFAALNAGLTQAQMTNVAQAVANLNEATDANSTSLATTQLSTMYGEDYLADQVSEYATGATTDAAFNNATSTPSISEALAGTLPGSIDPTPEDAATPPAASSLLPQTQSSTKSTDSKKSGGGLGTGGIVALATVLPIVAIIAVVAVAAVLISRRNSQSESPSSQVWYRRPFARSGGQSLV